MFSRRGSEVVGKLSYSASNVFRNGALKMSAHFLTVSARAGFVCLFQIFYVGLRSCQPIVWSFDHSSVGVLFGGSCFSLSSLWWQVLQTFWRECFALSRGIFSLPSFLLFSLRRMSRQAYSCLSNGILIIPKVANFLEVLRIFWKACSETASDVMGSLLPGICSSRLIMEKVLIGCFPFIRNYFLV